MCGRFTFTSELSDVINAFNVSILSMRIISPGIILLHLRPLQSSMEMMGIVSLKATDGG